MSAQKTPQALFINSGILGHKSLAKVLREASAHAPGFSATHVDLSQALTTGEKIARRLLCFQTPGLGRLGARNADLARWRNELYISLLGARRLRALEHGGRRFDVLHFHTQATAYASIRRMRRTPSIVSIDVTQQLAALEAPSRLERITYAPNAIHDGYVFRAASRIVASSQWAASSVSNAYSDCADKITVMPFPISVAGFDEDWIKQRYERSERRSAQPLRVLFIGGDFERKGGLELLKAWQDGSFHNHAHLSLVTNWPLELSAIPPGVSIVRDVSAYTPAWFDLWRQADIFVMPTRSDAFGYVYQEAAAAGLPCIGSRINAVPELIQEQVTGLLVPPRNTPELVQCLRTLLGSADLRRQMGTAARKRVEARAEVNGYCDRLSGMIYEILPSNGRRK